MAYTSHITNSLTSRTFFYGLGAGLSVYALLAGWVYFGSSVSLQNQQERLASLTLPIERLTEIPVAGLKEDDRVEAIESQEVTDSSPTEDEQPTEDGSSAKTLAEDAESLDMRAAPYPGLYETNAKGDLLPVIRADDGLSPFHAYRKPFILAADQKLIALVIDDYGLSRSLSSGIARNLPGEVTFMLSPYANDADVMQETARSNGHEIWLKLPMENQNFPQEDPGSKAILSRVSLEKNMDNLRWTLSRTSGYAGLALYNDLAFTRTKSTLSAVLKEAVDRGLGLFDMNISAPAHIQDTAERYNAPYIKNEIFFHDPKWAGDTGAAAELLETLAESRGHAVGVFKNYLDTLDFIERWLPELESKGFTLAPLSAIYLAQNTETVKPTPPAQEDGDASD